MQQTSTDLTREHFLTTKTETGISFIFRTGEFSAASPGFKGQNGKTGGLFWEMTERLNRFLIWQLIPLLLAPLSLRPRRRVWLRHHPYRGWGISFWNGTHSPMPKNSTFRLPETKLPLLKKNMFLQKIQNLSGTTPAF